MKKSIIALMGLFTLVACSEDSYQEGDRIKETVEDGSGSQNSVKSDATGYISPWNIHNQYQFDHGLFNFTDNMSPAARLTLRITPYVGLAYYDGVADGILHQMPGYSPSVMVSSYPNFFPNGKEYGNVFDAKPIIMGNTPSDVNELLIYGEGYCPVGYGIVSPAHNPRGEFFDIYHHMLSTTESNLIMFYGKVMYYRIEAMDAAGNLAYDGYVNPVQNTGLDYSQWDTEGITDTHLGYPTIFNIDPTNGLISSPLGPVEGSREVMVDDPSINNTVYFSYNGFNYRIYTILTHLSSPGTGANINRITTAVQSY